MHKIPVGADKAGLAFVICVAFMILVSLPQARVFVALSLPAGLIVGLILYMKRRKGFPDPRDSSLLSAKPRTTATTRR